MDEDQLLAELRDTIMKQRGYAGFYEWRDKPIKERGILQDFAEAATRDQLGISEIEPVPPGDDPPDAWAVHERVKLAIELTEFVDGELVARQQQTGETQWRWWTQEEALRHLYSLIEKKDHAGFGKGSKYWLIIHCDEPALNAEILGKYIGHMAVAQPKGIDRCFVLLSYEPRIKGAPLLEVPVCRAA